MIISYIATGSTFIPCPKELQPDTTRILIPNRTESIYKTNSSNYGTIHDRRSAHRYHPIDNSCAFFCYHRQITFHQHWQPPIPVIGIDQSPPDLVTSSCLLIGIITHRNLFYQSSITFSPADPYSINFSGTCPKTVSTHAPQFRCMKSLMLQKFSLIITPFLQ